MIEEHNLDNVINTARTLLEEDIFASTLKAKIRFPEAFEVSPAQSAERSASEAEAARSEADAIKHAAEGHQAEWTTILAGVQDEVQGQRSASSSLQTQFDFANWHSL